MKSLSRRTLLRGVGIGVSLPWLEAMAAPKRPRAPLRFAVLYVPNGVHMPDWTPSKAGTDFTLPSILEPLRSVRDEITVLTGLEQRNAFALGDGPGDHARALGAFLTGAHPHKTNGANIKNGISADQVAAQKLGHLTRLPSLELGVDRGAQSGNCDSGYSCAYSSNLAWKSDTMPLAKEVDPSLVFDRLFGMGVDPKRDRQKRSILDFVARDLESLKPRLGKTDNRKMDEYLTAVREIEQRIARFGQMPPVDAPAFGRPEEIPSDNQEHIRLMCDLLVVAFQSDITRIATFLVANAGSNKSYPHLEIPEGHHELSHHGRNPEKLQKISRINRFHATQLAYLLEKLKSIGEGDGTLLDNSMIVYGSGIGDGDRHNHDDLPVVLAGRGGGTVKPGRHLRYEKLPLNNLYVSLLDRIGVPVDTFGDSTGRLAGLV